MEIKNVMIAGGGTLGSQVAWQTAFHGFNVTVYDPFEEGIEKSKGFHREFAELFKKERGATAEAVEAALGRLSYTSDMEEAVRDADLLNESIPENVELKRSFYTDLGKIAPEKTIFTTNTSSTLPHLYAEASGRPEKLLGLHFATGGIWNTNIGEVMGHAGTSDAIFDQVVEFARAIGMVAIPIKKEVPGFLFNSIFIPFLIAGIDLAMNEVATPKYIDKTWVIGSKSTFGPCAFMDIVGMGTVYHVLKSLAEVHQDETFNKRASWIKANFIDTGKMGKAAGEGFYTYPNPEYEHPDFLKK